MTNEEQKNDLIEKAVEEALAIPEPKVEEFKEREPYLFEKASFRKGLKNLFKTGSSDKNEIVLKLDSEGNEIVHGNNGRVHVKKT